ncbi:MAG: hypothetical protein SPE78_02910 [Actinobacillus minor]|nr:hypothetical protein [Actinobacillus minor]
MFTHFPELPRFKGEWRAIQLEPIVGSGERITVAISALGQNGEHKAIQAIRPELLECLYGNKAKDISNLISLILYSVKAQHTNLNEWVAPFEGVIMTSAQKTISEDIDGILRQAIQLSASLSSLALTVEHNEETQSSQVKKENARWANTIKELVISRKPALKVYFDAQYQATEKSPIKSKLSFAAPNYVANIGILQPTRLSPSVQSLKSKILDIEIFNDNLPLFKEREITKEIIVGIPNIEEDITLSNRNIQSIKDYVELLHEISDKQNILLHTVNSHNQAANRIIRMAT